MIVVRCLAILLCSVLASSSYGAPQRKGNPHKCPGGYLLANVGFGYLLSINGDKLTAC